jgi:hypothetical protein
MKIGVTGCPRSGTVYISKVIKALGCNIGHEEIGPDGIVSAFIAVDAKETSAGPGWLSIPYRKNMLVVHQVRNPIDCIRSMQCLELSMDWMSQYIYIPSNAGIVEKLARYWIYWNIYAEQRSTWTYRIEALPEIFETWCKVLRLPHKPEVLGKISTKTNTKHRGKKNNEYRELSLGEIIEESGEMWTLIKMQARKYGYEDSCYWA